MVDTEPLVGSLAALVVDRGQQVSVAFAGRQGAFPGECSVSRPVDPGPRGLRLVYPHLHWRVRVIPQFEEPLGEVGSNWRSQGV